MIVEYIAIDRLSKSLGLPSGFLKGLANKGSIPYLDVNGRKRFNERNVRDALSAMEKESDKSHTDPIGVPGSPVEAR